MRECVQSGWYICKCILLANYLTVSRELFLSFNNSLNGWLIILFRKIIKSII